jgi:glutaredoxin/glutathione-dependent peroxiredoxin
MTIAPGDKLPTTTFVKVGADGSEPVSSDDFFAGRRVALFSVPGAFTPTCSACTAVNDPFVMGAWSKASAAGDAVTMLADGNGAFPKAVGLEMDGSKFGMGTRGQRFAMVVNDGVVEQLFVEAPGEFRVSSADHMLENI